MQLPLIQYLNLSPQDKQQFKGTIRLAYANNPNARIVVSASNLDLSKLTPGTKVFEDVPRPGSFFVNTDERTIVAGKSYLTTTHELLTADETTEDTVSESDVIGRIFFSVEDLSPKLADPAEQEAEDARLRKLVQGFDGKVVELGKTNFTVQVNNLPKTDEFEDGRTLLLRGEVIDDQPGLAVSHDTFAVMLESGTLRVQ